MKRRIWSERVPIEALRGTILDALAERGIQLLVAVHPGDEPAIERVVSEARRRGLSIGLWPLLADRDGRWLNASNAAAFAAWAERVAQLAEVDTIALDLEPPIDWVRAVLGGRLRALIDRPAIADRLETVEHRVLVAKLRARGVEVLAAAVPPTAVDRTVGRGWQAMLGTPIDSVGYEVVSPMLYTTLFEGYSRGWIDRGDARQVLSWFAAETAARFRDRAACSLGCVGIGALGDERTYRGVLELADDVGIARAHGIEDLALFDLGGVLERPPIGGWLDALVRTPAAERVPIRGRVAALRRVVDAIGRLAGRVR